MSRFLTAYVAVGVALASPALAPLCAAPAAQAHPCCAASHDCHLTSAAPQLRCCEAPPAQRGASSERGVLGGSGPHVALAAGSPAPAHAALVERGAPWTAHAAAPDPLATFDLPLRL